MGSKNRPDHKIHAHYKWRMKLNVVAVLSIAFMLYVTVLLPDVVFSRVQQVIGPTWLVVARIAGGAALGPLLALVFFTSDSAFYGNGRTAKWVRSVMPSTVCATESGFTSGEATAVWFRYFDTWALPASPNQALLQTTYSATYSARLVFHLTRACFSLLLLSAATIGVNYYVLDIYKSFQDAWLHMLLLATYVAVLAWLLTKNWSGAMSDEPTGAWKRLIDVFGRSVALLRLEVLDGKPTFAEAMQRIEAIRAKCSPAESSR